MKYRLREDYIAKNVPNGRLMLGTEVWHLAKPDYGLARDDTRYFGEVFINVTMNENGDYPGFTVPQRVLEKIEDSFT